MRVLVRAANLCCRAACNPGEGVGKDIQSGGEAVPDSARIVKEAITA